MRILSDNAVVFVESTRAYASARSSTFSAFLLIWFVATSHKTVEALRMRVRLLRLIRQTWRRATALMLDWMQDSVLGRWQGAKVWGVGGDAGVARTLMSLVLFSLIAMMAGCWEQVSEILGVESCFMLLEESIGMQSTCNLRFYAGWRHALWVKVILKCLSRLTGTVSIQVTVISDGS